MAGLILACARVGRRPPAAAEVLRCARLIELGTFQASDPLLVEQGGLIAAILNPAPGASQHHGAVSVGCMLAGSGRWWQVGAPPPDGTFALARFDDDFVELHSDILATRTLWYVRTDQLFLASTSQRALVSLLGSFHPDREAVSWMVACGHLGSRSWDTRLRRLRGDERVTLDRRSWELTVERRHVDWSVPDLSDAGHKERLMDAILGACARVQEPMADWVLPLSGGIDSRLLLLGLLNAGKRPSCVTWGVRDSLRDPKNDASVAPRVAAALGVQHRFLESDRASEPADVVVHRFLNAGEAQTWDIGGYADGMAIWTSFVESGIAGVLRGDEPALGYYPHPVSEVQVRRWKMVVFLSEFPPDHPIHQLDLAEQSWDPALDRRDGETLRAWDDRLWEEVKFPVNLAPLTTIKSTFVEIESPMQSRSVVEVARGLPDTLRLHHASLATIARWIGPDVPFATRGALGGVGRLLTAPAFVGAMREAFASDAAEAVFPRAALDRMISRLPSGDGGERASRSGLVTRAKAMVPQPVIDWVRPEWPVRLSEADMALRAYAAVYMARRLSADARAGREAHAAMAGGR